MDYEQIEALRERHSAWRLLRAGNASLVLVSTPGALISRR